MKKQKSRRPQYKIHENGKKLILFCFIISILTIGYFLFFNEDNNFLTYKNFGIRLPWGFSVHGIDVSKYQQKINWDLVADMNSNGKKISFVL